MSRYPFYRPTSRDRCGGARRPARVRRYRLRTDRRRTVGGTSPKVPDPVYLGGAACVDVGRGRPGDQDARCSGPYIAPRPW